MSTQYDLTISKLDTYDTRDKTDVVRQIYWRLKATKGAISSEHYGAALLPPPSDNFTPLNELTEAQVVQWLQEHMNYEVVKKALDDEIRDKENSPKTIDPPWIPTGA